MADLDPITQCYQAIRTLLLNQFTGRLANFKPLNFPDMSSATFDTFKNEVQPADLPEAILLQGAFELKPLGRNSQATSFTQVFPLVGTQDNLRVTPVNSFKFQTLIGLLKGGQDFGLKFVRDWSITGGMDDPFGQQEWKRGTLRYLSILQIRVEMDVSRQQLLALP